MHPHTLVIWMGAICTVGLMSLLYRENRVFRFFEHVFIGVTTGFFALQAWQDTIQPDWYVPMTDTSKKWGWLWMLAAVAGALYFTIYSPRYSWMSRLVIGGLLGVAAGQEFRRFVGEVQPQLLSSMAPLLGPGLAKAAGEQGVPSVVLSINRVIFLIILICVMTYFFFSVEHKNKPVQIGARGGRWFLMFAFGAIFGSTVMARFGLFIARLQFLVDEWWPVAKFW